jgi:dTDP-6-deoxy-L-talose 4-dehydrogenase (NAD+)
MKQVLLTGATGFIGQHVVPALLEQGYEVIAVAREQKKLQSMSWKNKVRFIACDLHDLELDTVKILGIPEMLIHLAWPGLPNYKDFFHFEENLPADYRFIRKMVTSGVKHVLVTGTCFEYGMQSGMLSEDTPTAPANPYGLAKDTLRKFLQSLQKTKPFTLQWLRLFYIYGPGQNPNSLFAQLDSAIDRGDTVFNMSGGEQLRDYLPVEEVAHRIALLAEHPECDGIFNCCSGKPISVRRLVKEHLVRRGVHIKLNLGYYPYPDYEPMAFWGDCRRLEKILLKGNDYELG